jgi:photosystem II stability/assembly factor-like uncharacterized protein
LLVASLAGPSTAIDYTSVDSLFTEHFKTAPTSIKGSGFKPWQRFRWFMAPRVYPDRDVPAGAVQRAWTEVQAMKASTPRGGESWFQIGPTNRAGRMKDIAIDPVDPLVMYAAAASGGLWKTTDGAVTWFALDDGLPSLGAGAVAIDPNDHNVVYLGSGEGHYNADAVLGVGVLKSTDAGATWNTTGLSWDVTQGRAVNAIRIDGVNGTIMAATSIGLHRSTDGGASWTLVLGNETCTDVEIRSDDPQIMYACVGYPWGTATNGLYVSSDNGQSFTPVVDAVFPPTSQIGRCMVDYCDAVPTTVYFTVSGTFGFNGTALVGVYRSIDGGATWELRATSPNFYSSQGWYDNVLAVHPVNPDVVFVGGIDIYKTLNGGTNWTRRTAWDAAESAINYVHADQHAFAFHPNDPETVFAGCDGGIFRSTNGGTAWTARVGDLCTYQFYAMGQALQDSNLLMGGCQDNGSNLYTGADDTWDHVFGGDGGYCVIDYTNPNKIYAEWQFGNMVKSADGGSSWADFTAGITEDGAWVTPFLIHPTNPLTFYSATKYVYRTTNGHFWTKRSSQLSNSEMITMDICESNPDWIYTVANARSVWYTNDGTTTWTACSVTGLPSRKAVMIAVDPHVPQRAVLVFSGYGTGHVYRTTDAGASWADISGNLPDMPVNAVKFDPAQSSHLYIGTEFGVFRTTNGGVSWEPFMNGLPNVVVTDLRLHPTTRTLRAATYGRGMWETELGPIVAVEPDAITPEPLFLSRQIPNPIQGAAAFRFGVRAREHVRLAIYDITGREVAVLVDGEVAPGIHSATWEANVADGIYLMQLQARSGAALSRKIVVQR